MTQEIIPIRLPFPLNVTTVNSYLVRTDGGFFLIDTGFSNSRHRLESELERHGCQPGNLKLILLTHGDFDHIGNATHIRNKYSSKIAMHAGDVGMLERGDMFWNRSIDKQVIKKMMSLFIRFGEKDRSTPDILLEDGASLAEYGIDAKVFNVPGHSTGSICILTASGDLFCGDLFTNSTGKPELNAMMYDNVAGNASLARLKTVLIQTVYPGHGAAFSWEAILD